MKTINLLEGQNAKIITYLLEHNKITAKEIAADLYQIKKPSASNIAMVHKTLKKLQDVNYITEKTESGVKYFSLTEPGTKKYEQEKQEQEETEKKRAEREKLLKEEEDRGEESMSKLKEFFYEKHMIDFHNKESKITLNYKALDVHCPELAELLLQEPTQFLYYCGQALRDIPDCSNIPQIVITNPPSHIKTGLAETRKTKNLTGKLLAFEGTIVNVSPVSPYIVETIWVCEECGEKSYMPSRGSFITRPFKCFNCNNRTFKESNKKFMDHQVLTLQEPELTDNPAEIKVVLAGQLVEHSNPEKRQFIPGGPIEIYGFAQETSTKRDSAKVEPQIHAIGIQPGQHSLGEIRLTEEDVAKVRELANNKNVYENLVDSVCPAIHGMEKVKEGILLQGFGGVPKTIAGSKKRGNIHVLLLGDPSTAKTLLLQFMAAVVPKSRIVNGGQTTSVGITAAAVKESEGWILKIGAMSLCNKGLLIIDELNKMKPEDTGKLNEGMEEQIIHIDRAGIHATLPAETSVLAACNPKEGGFLDDYKSIREQLPEGMTDSLESRFDEVFIIKDAPEPERDGKIADKMLAESDDIAPKISPDNLRKYIAYAKRITPTWTKKTKKALKEYWLALRKLGAEDSIRITPRVLETLRRLSEAVARAYLSKTVTVEYIKKANALLKYIYKGLGKDISKLMGDKKND